MVKKKLRQIKYFAELQGMKNNLFRLSINSYNIYIINISTNSVVKKTNDINELQDYGFQVQSLKLIKSSEVESILMKLEINALYFDGRWKYVHKTDAEGYNFTVICDLNKKLEEYGYKIEYL